jgi:hypothetical protein
VNPYGPLRDFLATQTATELVLSLEKIEEILGFELSRASHRASWWDSARAPDEKMPQREACLEAGYIATRLADGKGVRFRKIKAKRPFR